MRLAAFCLLAFLCAPWPALAQLAGAWEVVEYDPLMPENDFFGQFRYRLEIVEVGGEFRVKAPRTGAKFAPAPLRDGRFVARGEEPNRGAATLDVAVRDGRFEGTIAFSSMRRRIVGTLDPSAQLGAVSRQLGAAQAQAESAKAAAETASVERDALERRLIEAESRLAAAEREAAAERIARQQAEQALADSRRRAAELEVRASRPPATAPAAPTPPPASAPPLPSLLPAPAPEPQPQPTRAGDVSTRCYELAVLPAAPEAEALEICRAAVRRGDRAMDHYHLGVALSRLGRHEEAILAWREAAARWAR